MTALAAIPADPIGLLMPWTEGEERHLRNRLLRAQQYSARRARQSESPLARHLLWLVNETAASIATSRASVQDLQDIVDTLTRLTLAANGFQRLERSCGR